MVPRWWNWPLNAYGRKVVCRKLGIHPGASPREFEAAVRGFQRARGIPVHGMVDVVTAKALGEEANLAPPEWFDEGMTRVQVRDHYALDEDTLRRVEGNAGILPGEGDPAELARILERA